MEATAGFRFSCRLKALGPPRLTTSIMPNPRTKIPIKFRLLALFLIVVGVIVIVTTIISNRESQVARSPTGHIIKLERYAFQRGTVRYELPNRPIVGPLSRMVPDNFKKRIKWLKPEVTCFSTPAFRNEPLLSAAFGSWDASGKPERRPGTRLAISDDHGQMFDSVLNYLGNSGVFEAPAFPRRGKELRLHLMKAAESLAQFRIPNPCPGPHPRWKAAPIPLVVTNGGLEITLEKFTADSVRLRTRCVFVVRENGQESTAWLPWAFEVSDATGNHWRPAVDLPQKTSDE